MRNVYAMNSDWFAPANQTARTSSVKTFLCPGANGSRTGQSTFNGTAYTGAAWDYTNVAVVAKDLLVYLNYPDAANSYLNYWRGTMSSTGSTAAQITDGLSNTILVAEDAGRPEYWVKGRRETALVPITFNGGPGVTTGGLWADHQKGFGIEGTQPAGYPEVGECAINCNNSYEIYAFHTGGANVAMADGSVRFLSEGMSIRTLAALATRGAGEVISE